MPDVTKLSTLELERLVDARLKANHDAAVSAGEPVNLRAGSPTGDTTSDSAPVGTAWRGSVSPFTARQSTLTVEAARACLDFFRAVNQKDAAGARKALERSGMSGERIQQLAVSADGGYTAPEQFVSEVLIELPKLTPFADPNIVRIVPMTKETLRWTKVVTRPSNPSYIAEGAQYGKTGVKFAPITLVAKKIGEIIPFSEEILESNEIGMVQVIAQLVAEAFAFKYNSLVTTGAGDATEPEGVLTNANIAAATWTTTDDSTKSDSVISIFHALKMQYRSDAIWMMPDAIVAIIRKLKDTTKRYLWTDGFGSTPAMILGRPVFTNEDQTAATILFGNFKRGYIIGKKAGLTADQNSSGTDWEKDIVNYKFRERWDGRVHDESAFVKSVSVS